MTTFAVIPACGKSTRMGRPKLALPLGDRTVIEHVVDALRDGGVDHLLVVVGPHVPELVPLARQSGAEVLQLAEATADMRATIEHGLRFLEERFHPQDTDGWLLAPADHPTLDADVVRQVLDARVQASERSIVIPTFQGKRGHPTLIDWKHVRSIRALPANQGLNTYLRCQPDVLELPLAQATVLDDLDTPEDYERLRQNAKRT